MKLTLPTEDWPNPMEDRGISTLCHDMPWFPVSFLIDSMLKPDMLTQISDVLHLLDAVVQGRYLKIDPAKKPEGQGGGKSVTKEEIEGKSCCLRWVQWQMVWRAVADFGCKML
jgi:hypothetical protein